MSWRVSRSSPDRGMGAVHPRQHEPRPEVRKETGIFEDQKIILQQLDQKVHGSLACKEARVWGQIVKSFANHISLFCNSREPRKEMSQDYSSFQGSAGWFPGCLILPFSPSAKSLLLWPPGRAQGWVTSVLLPGQGGKVRDDRARWDTPSAFHHRKMFILGALNLRKSK